MQSYVEKNSESNQEVYSWKVDAWRIWLIWLHFNFILIIIACFMYWE